VAIVSSWVVYWLSDGEREEDFALKRAFPENKKRGGPVVVGSREQVVYRRNEVGLGTGRRDPGKDND
jgi:hypothetical protein